MLNIVSIDVKCNLDMFKNILSEKIKNENNAHGTNIKIAMNNKALTSGKQIMDINLKDDSQAFSNNGAEYNIVARVMQDTLIFSKLIIREYNNSFYGKVDGDNCEYLEGILNTSLTEAATKTSGTYASILNDGTLSSITIIDNGIDTSSNGVIAVIDKSNNHVYSWDKQASELNLNDTADDDMDTYVPAYTLDEWLEDNIVFKSKISSLPKNKQFEMMAQYAIYQKTHGSLNTSKFKDVFMQCYSMLQLFGEIKDQMVQQVYELIS